MMSTMRVRTVVGPVHGENQTTYTRYALPRVLPPPEARRFAFFRGFVMNENKVPDRSSVVIPAFAVNELHLSGDELIVYSVILGFTNDGNSRYNGGTKYLSCWTGKSKQTINNLFNSLIEKGLIKQFVYENGGVQFCEYAAELDETKWKIVDIKGEIKRSKNEEQKPESEQARKFKLFWQTYPVKTDRQRTIEIWAKLLPDDELFDKIMKAIAAQQREKEEKKRNGQFAPEFPMPSTWLHRHRWEDEVDVEVTEGTSKKHVEYHIEITEDGREVAVPNE